MASVVPQSPSESTIHHRAKLRVWSYTTLYIIHIAKLNHTADRIFWGSAPRVSMTLAATPSPSRSRPSRMCSVPM